MDGPPPPPPPHGTSPPGGGRAGGLPDGKYDIFVIPQHSAGSGFLYLPSLNTQRNSFLAGVFCTATTFLIYTTAVPVMKAWLMDTVNGGGGGVYMLICVVGVLAWAFGKTQGESATASSGPARGQGSSPGAGAPPRQNAGGFPHTGPPPQSPPHQAPPPPPNPGASSPPPHSSWQRPSAQANTKANATNPKSSWEKAREETRKREEEKKKAEELRKRREELEKERQKLREKELRERLERELKEKREREEKERKDRELEKEKEKAAAEEKLKQERLEKEKAAAAAARAAATSDSSSPKRPPMPSARTEREDDAYSFRPYDRPKRSYKANSGASVYSESSYTPSVSTAKTTPPPSMRGPYSTTDPDKIVIKGVFSFNNAFMRTPISQLISGKGSVTDGLILRITTEGLFIDDDVRGVPQREWDIKAWTMKLAEVWCPFPSLRSGPGKADSAKKRLFSFGPNASPKHESSPSQSESAAFVAHLLDVCTDGCKDTRSRRDAQTSRENPISSSPSRTPSQADTTNAQSCELAGMHILRASIRDQEGKKYVFVMSQSEGWKVAVGLQRLRRGSQVRALGVAGLPQNEAKAMLENLGYA